jgi:hypothetical protein
LESYSIPDDIKRYLISFLGYSTMIDELQQPFLKWQIKIDVDKNNIFLK